LTGELGRGGQGPRGGEPPEEEARTGHQRAGDRARPRQPSGARERREDRAPGERDQRAREQRGGRAAQVHRVARGGGECGEAGVGAAGRARGDANERGAGGEGAQDGRE